MRGAEGAGRGTWLGVLTLNPRTTLLVGGHGFANAIVVLLLDKGCSCATLGEMFCPAVSSRVFGVVFSAVAERCNLSGLG